MQVNKKEHSVNQIASVIVKCFWDWISAKFSLFCSATSNTVGPQTLDCKGKPEGFQYRNFAYRIYIWKCISCRQICLYVLGLRKQTYFYFFLFLTCRAYVILKPEFPFPLSYYLIPFTGVVCMIILVMSAIFVSMNWSFLGCLYSNTWWKWTRGSRGFLCYKRVT